MEFPSDDGPRQLRILLLATTALQRGKSDFRVQAKCAWGKNPRAFTDAGWMSPVFKTVNIRGRSRLLLQREVDARRNFQVPQPIYAATKHPGPEIGQVMLNKIQVLIDPQKALFSKYMGCHLRTADS